MIFASIYDDRSISIWTLIDSDRSMRFVRRLIRFGRRDLGIDGIRLIRFDRRVFYLMNNGQSMRSVRRMTVIYST